MPNNSPNRTEKKFLQLVREKKYEEVDAFLLELEKKDYHDFDVNVIDSNYQTALYIAVKNNDNKMAKRILQVKNIDPNKGDENVNKNSAFVRIFKDSIKKTPLFEAVQNGNEEITEALLANSKLDINISYEKDINVPIETRPNGKWYVSAVTPIQLAFIFKKVQIIILLLKQADLKLKDITIHNIIEWHVTRGDRSGSDKSVTRSKVLSYTLSFCELSVLIGNVEVFNFIKQYISINGYKYGIAEYILMTDYSLHTWLGSSFWDNEEPFPKKIKAKKLLHQAISLQKETIVKSLLQKKSIEIDKQAVLFVIDTNNVNITSILIRHQNFEFSEEYLMYAKQKKSYQIFMVLLKIAIELKVETKLNLEQEYQEVCKLLDEIVEKHENSIKRLEQSHENSILKIKQEIDEIKSSKLTGLHASKASKPSEAQIEEISKQPNQEKLEISISNTQTKDQSLEKAEESDTESTTTSIESSKSELSTSSTLSSQNGSEIDPPSPNALDSIKLAVMKGDLKEIEKTYGKNKKEIEKKLLLTDGCDRNIIHFAAYEKQNNQFVKPEVLEYLCKLAIDRHQKDLLLSRDNQENTPLHLAVLTGNTNGVSVLIKFCQPRGEGKWDETAKYLAKLIDMVDIGGNTALLLAIQSFNGDIVRLLVKADAEFKIENCDGKSVFDYIYQSVETGNDALFGENRREILRIQSYLELLKLYKNAYIVAKSFRNGLKIRAKQISIGKRRAGKNKLKNIMQEHLFNEILPKNLAFKTLVMQYEFYLPNNIVENLARSLKSSIANVPIQNEDYEAYIKVSKPKLVEALEVFIKEMQDPSPLTALVTIKSLDSQQETLSANENEFLDALRSYLQLQIYIYHAIQLQLVSKPDSKPHEILESIKTQLPLWINATTSLASYFMPSATLQSAVKDGGNLAGLIAGALVSGISTWVHSNHVAKINEEVQAILEIFYDKAKNRISNFKITSICDQMRRRYQEQIHRLPQESVHLLAKCLCDRIIGHILVGKNVYEHESAYVFGRLLQQFWEWKKRSYNTTYKKPDRLPLEERCVLALYYEKHGRDDIPVKDVNGKQVYAYGYIELCGIKALDAKGTYQYYKNDKVDSDNYGFCEGTITEAINLRGFKLMEYSPEKDQSKKCFEEEKYSKAELTVQHSPFIAKKATQQNKDESTESEDKRIEDQLQI